MRDLVRMSDIIRIYNNYDCDKAREEVMKLPPIDMVGELEKIKDRLETAMWYNRRDKEYCLDLINKRISELKEGAE